MRGAARRLPRDGVPMAEGIQDFRRAREAQGTVKTPRGFGRRCRGLRIHGEARAHQGTNAQGHRGRPIKKRILGERGWFKEGVRHFLRLEYQVIAELSSKWPVAALCDEMSVNRSGFYKWLRRQPSPSERVKKRIDAVALFLEYHARFPSHGYRWLNAKIKIDLGVVYTDEFARRCCRYAGIRSRSKHYRYKAPGEPRKTYPNLVLASLKLTGPMQCVVSDMTAFWAGGKYWELTLYMDLWNNEIVAYGLSAKKGDPSTYFEALDTFVELKKKYPELGTIFHSDQGSVYSSKAFNEALLAYDIMRTMSRVGTPTDNGAMEAINGWAKVEMLIDFRIGDSDDVPKAVAGYIRFFNEERPMCCLGYMTPKQFREESIKANPCPLPPDQCLHLPMVVDTK